MNAPTATEINDVATKAVEIFAKYGLESCLFGSTACALYGCTRTPNDVDLVVMTQDHTQEELKQVLVRDRNSGFYTRAPRTFGATYRVLFCSLRGRQRSCKVDILIPGILEIPQISPRRFAHVGGLPLIPIITLLILKLKGWDDHRQSGRSDFRLKQYVDIRDINQLLAIVVEAGANLNSDRVYLPSEFVQQAEERLTKFIQAVRNTTRTSHWKQIGFSVPDELWL